MFGNWCPSQKVPKDIRFRLQDRLLGNECLSLKFKYSGQLVSNKSLHRTRKERAPVNGVVRPCPVVTGHQESQYEEQKTIL
jgi:hypothetical protein